MKEAFEPRAFDFPPRRGVVIVGEDRLDRFELVDGEPGIARIERLECLEHLDWWRIDCRWIVCCRFLGEAIEQAASAVIAARGHAIPRRHPAKINTFLDLYELESDLEDQLLYWLRRHSESQYVDIREDEITIPHELFDQTDANEILADADSALTVVREAI